MTASQSSRLGLRVLLLVGALALSGCKEVLYSDLSEAEANEMVAILDAGGISAAREREKGGTYEIKVDEALVASAVTLLQSAGYPKQRYESLGDVFAGDGIVGSAFNERARFMHAMNEELSRTLSEIDGVRSARVQIMIPAEDKYDTNPKSATASVAVMHDERRDLTPLVPMIKNLVAHSVPNLAYGDVSVALFPATIARPAVGPEGNSPQTKAMSLLVFDLPPVVVGVVLGILGSTALVLLMPFLRRGRPDNGSGT